MNNQPAHLIFLVGIAVYLGIRAFYQIRYFGEKKPISKNNLRERLLVGLVATGQVVLPLIFLFSPWLKLADYTLPPAAVWIGTPLMTVALWLFWRSHTDLGNSWSVTLELNHNHRLVTRGVYRHIRHPMYAAFFTLAASQALLLDNWLAGWAALAAVSLLYIIRVPHEEAMMFESFGEEYRHYARHTGRLLPLWRRIP